ncbi:MAG: glutamate--cysteine ligase [Woeseiaceae bacterium]|nr:glutamate--cysteine ligase [Woeseiaceae bacterium]
MNKLFEKRLNALVSQGSGNLLSGGLRGVEKESLRVTETGVLSSRPHPVALGSALTNDYITTDFAEPLLEFVTPAFSSNWQTLRFLCDIHQFTYEHLADELLWVASMPCLMTSDRDIPIARYGSSNVAKMKTIYRRGLGYRYGRTMQTIAGLHFNYSLPEAFWPVYREMRQSDLTPRDFRSAEYFGLVRNFRRLGWIVPYLFGASPALCKSFVSGDNHGLEEFDPDTLYQPYATSLRMSDLGYSNRSQAGINISLNSLDEYVRELSEAIDTPDPDYEKIGVKVDGQYRQLSSNRLQIENEYYSPVRPKRVARSGERPTSALRRGGVQYVEIRSLDLGIADPAGINQNVMRFMEAFLIYCLLSDSPPLGDQEYVDVLANHTQTAKRGRDPDFRLRRDGEALPLASWADAILDGVSAVADVLDAADDGGDYATAVSRQRDLVHNPDQTPSALILEDLRRESTGFFRYALQRARDTRDYFAALEPLSTENRELFEREAAESLRRQAAIETSDDIEFDEYLANYYAS